MKITIISKEDGLGDIYYSVFLHIPENIKLECIKFGHKNSLNLSRLNRSALCNLPKQLENEMPNLPQRMNVFKDYEIKIKEVK